MATANHATITTATIAQVLTASACHMSLVRWRDSEEIGPRIPSSMAVGAAIMVVPEAPRCLKRRLARVVFHHLTTDHHARADTCIPTAA